MERNVLKNFSVAQLILAILWRAGEGTLKVFFKHPYHHLLASSKSKKTYLSSLNRLRNKGYIEMKGRKTIVLASAGKGAAYTAFIKAEICLHRQKEYLWDGGWRIIIFDIPEKKRRQRDYLRGVLKDVGFRELQRSIWIYPYHVPMFLRDLLLAPDIAPHIRFIAADQVQSDQDLKKLFKLV